MKSERKIFLKLYCFISFTTKFIFLTLKLKQKIASDLIKLYV